MTRQFAMAPDNPAPSDSPNPEPRRPGFLSQLPLALALTAVLGILFYLNNWPLTVPMLTFLLIVFWVLVWAGSRAITWLKQRKAS